jgi:hypothetical protein
MGWYPSQNNIRDFKVKIYEKRGKGGISNEIHGKNYISMYFHMFPRLFFFFQDKF